MQMGGESFRSDVLRKDVVGQQCGTTSKEHQSNPTEDRRGSQGSALESKIIAPIYECDGRGLCRLHCIFRLFRYAEESVYSPRSGRRRWEAMRDFSFFALSRPSRTNVSEDFRTKFSLSHGSTR